MSSVFMPHIPQTDKGFVPGVSSAVQGLNKIITELAATDIPILLFGESGTGKDTYARMIHCLLGFDRASFNKVACAQDDTKSLSEQIRSALTVEQPGTLFLDGIDELEPACQRMLLSLLPDGEPRPNHRSSPVRLVSSSHENLEKQVEQGNFRRELYFRINAVRLRLPPLRERKEDIPALFDNLLARHSNELQRTPPLVDSQSMSILVSYDWPGNIRELGNVVRKIVALGNVDAALADLSGPSEMRLLETGKTPSSLKLASRAASNRAEREMILKALAQTQWNRKRAARELQISYKSLLYKIKELVVQKSDAGIG
jgi:two-component system, NtrC family, response regulator AtoC